LIEALKDFWTQLGGFQKLVVVFITVFLVVLLGWLAIQNAAAWNETRKLEREAKIAKDEAKKHLEIAAKIAREKVELEKKLSELEATIDVKNKEAHQATANTADARLEYERTLRERRTDDPGADELCLELAALGYACR
jgi:hypothetical protein